MGSEADGVVLSSGTAATLSEFEESGRKARAGSTEHVGVSERINAGQGITGKRER
jgi:hypothetical protein